MSQYRSHNIPQEQLLTIAANILDKAFFDTTRELAKRRFQIVEKGERVFLVNVALAESSEMRVEVRLDRSEARCEYNFSAFRNLIAQLLHAIAQRLNAKQPLPVFSTDEGQRWSYLIPATHSGPEGDDMLIVALDARQPGLLLIELMFIDPAQFRQPAVTAG